MVFPPPPIRGISSGGGFQFELQSVAGGSLQELDATARKIMDAARQRPELAATFTGFRPGVPQLDAQVDRAKAKALGVPLSDVFSSLQIFLGSLYVNDFNAFGRVYRVQLQAEPSFRASPERRRAALRAEPARASGQPAQMVPLSTLVTVKPITGPDTISHYNLYRTAEIAGDTAPGRQLRSGHRGHAGRGAQRHAGGHVLRVDGPRVPGARGGQPGGIRLRAVRALRVPRPRRAVRELARPPRGAPGGAARRPRRAGRPVAGRARERRVRPDRPRAPHRDSRARTPS